MKNPKGYIRLPRVSVYLTPKKLKKQIKDLESLTGGVLPNHNNMELRIEGRINYHDWVKINQTSLI